MKVIVTGGGGYIGTTLVPMLLDQGHEVTVVDRFFFGVDLLKSRDGGSQPTLIRDDVRWVGGHIFEGKDAVIDMAALSNDPAGALEPWKTVDINFLGRARVARLAREAGVSRYILTSSCSVYGFRDGLLDETTVPNPLTAYARANILAERDILPLASSDFCTSAVRFATLYGLSPRMRLDLAINAMIVGARSSGKIPIMKDGTQWRPFLHVQDAARALYLMLTAPVERIRGQVYNIGSEEQNYQIRTIAELVSGAMPSHPKLEWYGDPDNRSYRVSFRRAREELQFYPKRTPIDATVEIEGALDSGELVPSIRHKTVDWYRHLLTNQEAGDEVRLHDVVI
jgi:nucleoside-diphosphate-sugar epimerase